MAEVVGCRDNLPALPPVKVLYEITRLSYYNVKTRLIDLFYELSFIILLALV